MGIFWHSFKSMIFFKGKTKNKNLSNILWSLCEAKLNFKLIKSDLNVSEGFFPFVAIFG